MAVLLPGTETRVVSLMNLTHLFCKTTKLIPEIEIHRFVRKTDQDL